MSHTVDKIKEHGLTLVELLVVIGIMGMLSAIGAVVYSDVVRNQRDSTRYQDLLSVRQVLEFFRADQGYYPENINLAGSLAVGTKIYVSSFPSDSPPRQYVYSGKGTCISSQCSSYVLCAVKEGSKTFPEAPYDCSSLSCGAAEACGIAVGPID